EFEDGMSLLHEGVARWYETGAVLHRTHCELCLVEAHLHESKFAVAREHLARTRAHCESYGENYLASEIDRLEAILATHEGAPIAVAKKYVIISKSMAIARKQGARLLELRSATLLAQILAEQNERHLAVDILAPISGGFSEGVETDELKQARALLEQLW